MIAENKQEAEKNWQGPGKEGNADDAVTSEGGIATETQGREDNPDMYEYDVLDNVMKRDEDSIWKRGKEKRIKHKEEE